MTVTSILTPFTRVLSVAGGGEGELLQTAGFYVFIRDYFIYFIYPVWGSKWRGRSQGETSANLIEQRLNACPAAPPHGSRRNWAELVGSAHVCERVRGGYAREWIVRSTDGDGGMEDASSLLELLSHCEIYDHTLTSLFLVWDGYRLVTVHNHGDFIVLPHC